MIATSDDNYVSLIDEEVLIRERRAISSFYSTGDELQAEISRTLDMLLGGHYNKRVRPNYGGPPVLVELNLSARSIVSMILIFIVYKLSWREPNIRAT